MFHLLKITNTRLLVAAVIGGCLAITQAAKGVVVDVSIDKQEPQQQHREAGSSKKALAQLNSQLDARFPSLHSFPFANHIGKVGMGSGIYLGNGYVLTSAHVGCYPFRMQDGAIYRPDYKSWRILQQGGGAKADLAIFRIKIEDPDSPLAKLAPVPLASRRPAKDDLVILMGNGLVQSAKPVAVTSGASILAVLGYHIEGRRSAVGGLNTVSEIIATPVRTEAFQTDCFSTSFDRNGFEAQAVDGDSGGASFVYNRQRDRWELAGCIIAVSQKDGFVPFGSRTFMANLVRYAGQLPNASGASDSGILQTLAGASSTTSPNFQVRNPVGVTKGSNKVRPASIKSPAPELERAVTK